MLLLYIIGNVQFQFFFVCCRLILFNASSVVEIKVSFDISNSKEYEDIPKFEVIILIRYLSINRRLNQYVLEYLLFMIIYYFVVSVWS